MMSSKVREETTDAAIREAKAKLEIAVQEISRLSVTAGEKPAVVAWRSEKQRLEDRIRELRNKPRPE